MKLLVKIQAYDIKFKSVDTQLLLGAIEEMIFGGSKVVCSSNITVATWSFDRW